MTACLDCGRPGCKGSRCERCKALRAAESAYSEPGYAAEAARTRAAAGEHCPRCGEPYAPSNPPTAGHKVPVREGGTLADGLQAQCRRCNYGWKRTGL